MKAVKGQGMEAFLMKIQQELKEETYLTKPVKRVFIPKARKRKELRPLGIPTVKERVI